MNKIICDICGTSYQESAECCPICGCPRGAAEALLGEEIPMEESKVEASQPQSRFVPRKKEIFDFDEVNDPRPVPEDIEDDDAFEDDDDFEEDEDTDYDEEEDDDDEPRPNTFVVILLTILIAGLMFAAGFLFVRYFLPNMNIEETTPSTTAPAQLAESTDPAETAVPCEYMTMNNAAKAELSEIGQQFLLNVIVKPENTTDAVIFTSADESIATVSADGKITAVAEGETTIFISCGSNSMECPVVVKYVEETEAPTTEPAVETEETVPGEDADATGVATEPTIKPADPNVVLKLKKTDIQLGVYYYVTLELDCDLDPSQVEWSSEHPHIAKVDDKGVVTAMKEGTTSITAKYGDQEVHCMVRCGWY